MYLQKDRSIQPHQTFINSSKYPLPAQTPLIDAIPRLVNVRQRYNLQTVPFPYCSTALRTYDEFMPRYLILFESFADDYLGYTVRVYVHCVPPI